MKYLVDTNIFLEILLDQEKTEVCKEFLLSHKETLCISDFSLHSIGVILFRNNRENVFHNFTNDILSWIEIISLSKKEYSKLSDTYKQFHLDFDDSYQFSVAMDLGLEIVTMDSDFKKVANILNVSFL